MLGIDGDALNEENKENVEFLRCCKRYFEPNVSFTLKLFLAMNCPRIKNIFRFKLIDDHVQNFFMNLVDSIAKDREKNKIRRKDFLQLMLDLKQQELKCLTLSANESYEKIKRIKMKIQKTKH